MHYRKKFLVEPGIKVRLDRIDPTAVGFKAPSKVEAAHDFLWRVHARAPAKGEVVIFNRSHYEDVLVVRVHKLVPKKVWSKRYDMIQRLREGSVGERHAHPEVLLAHQSGGAARPL